jgi:uncharacterized membrane protein YhiD involved in acid resistance
LNETKEFLLIAIVFTGLIVGIASFISWVAWDINNKMQALETNKNIALTNYQNNVNQLKQEFIYKNYTVLQAQFNSPSVTVICPSLNNFYQKVTQLNTKTIYQVSTDSQWVTVDDISFGASLQAFYVIDSTATYAYSYTLPFGEY